VELGIGEAEDNGEYGSRDVAEEERKESRDFPILTLPNNDIEITADLVAL
jgi:hypothetical protein